MRREAQASWSGSSSDEFAGHSASKAGCTWSLFTDPLEALLDYRQWTLRSPGGARSRHVLAEGRLQGRELVAHLEGIEDRQAAQELVGAVIEVERAALPPTRAREYYRADLLGLAVSKSRGCGLRGACTLRRGGKTARRW